MPKVFISHSKHDKEYCDSFDSACARAGLQSFRSEFENIETPPWKTIKREINQSSALFLLIGKKFTERQRSVTTNTPEYTSWVFTQNWIAFEIGVASQKGIEVWVLCEDPDIYFPVPYLTNLYFWESKLSNPDQRHLIFFLKAYSKNNVIVFDKRMKHTCPNPNCKATYNIIQSLGKGVKLKCPSCLEIMEFPDGFNLYPEGKQSIFKKVFGK
jgi:hypothetical protein